MEKWGVRTEVVVWLLPYALELEQWSAGNGRVHGVDT